MAILDDLIAWWSLEESSGTRADSHGDHDLTDVNGVGVTTGKVGNGADFVAANAERLSHADDADLRRGQAMTVALWFKADALTGEHALYWKGGNPNAQREFVITIQGTTGLQLRAVVATPQALDLVMELSVDTWYFVVAEVEVTATETVLRLLVNDTDSATTSQGATTIFNSTDGLGVGDRPGGNRAFDGVIDEVAVWSRILTTQEKSDLWNGGNGVSYADIAGGGGTTVEAAQDQTARATATAYQATVTQVPVAASQDQAATASATAYPASVTTAPKTATQDATATAHATAYSATASTAQSVTAAQDSTAGATATAYPATVTQTAVAASQDATATTAATAYDATVTTAPKTATQDQTARATTTAYSATAESLGGVIASQDATARATASANTATVAKAPVTANQGQSARVTAKAYSASVSTTAVVAAQAATARATSRAYAASVSLVNPNKRLTTLDVTLADVLTLDVSLTDVLSLEITVSD